ncbi:MULTISPECIES: hypothetical protein [Dysgonomonas]|uniref:hypothetical protein n=1 Tax=Dysgonomonas TaxID=156973 RepID=UPI000AE26038|nr:MULTISPECIES: hypothetical protein [Dysgonomonas]
MSNDEGLKDFIQKWFEQFMGRFDRLDKFMDIMSGRHNVLNGERLLDNQDLCQMLNVSRRTLQQKCIRLNYRKLIDSKQGVGNDLETTETHYSALIFIDSNSSFTNKDI